ncbi:MFS transporter [Nocardioides iriomotensis]|uniref:MFS transporter n=1 Tax=Nocardioides iriomotensis TaxID=715784 RepID=A0A4Q5J2D3_9ACTN|nr:MFS transporter [Nocardioides iriomotensis]RYU12692.1 MFS transporter [Nocardioides iriomotensis]
MADEHADDTPGPTRSSAGDRARAAGRGASRAAAATGRGVRRVGSWSAEGARRAGQATGTAAGFTLRQARRASSAEGAGQSGLYRLIELHAFNAAGDAAVAISLAGTLFFQVPTEQARGQVAMFLGLTMLPFAIVAPLIGPFLDRYGQGRRWAIGATMALRGFLCWVLADAVVSESAALFPAALGCLVASKAYGVTRAAAVPRLLPDRLNLVKANSRISLAGVAGAAVSAPIAIGASTLGAEWSLRYAFLVFVGGTILAILLPAQVDHAAGDREPMWRRRKRPAVPRAVVLGLRSNAGLRLLSGFLTMFMAFLLRDEPFPGWEARPELLLGLVIGAAGLGSTIGITLGSILRNVRPEITVVVALLADAVVTVVVAVFYGLPTAVLLGLTAGLAQSFGKLSLDALIQREVPERTRASAFARSETLLQLSWVVGGFLGIGLPLVPEIGLGVTAAVLVLWSAFVLSTLRHRDPAPEREEPVASTRGG